MPAYLNQGFMVREPAWHGLGTVLEDYPGREEAMRLAGHAFEVMERPLYVAGRELLPGEHFRLELREGGDRRGAKVLKGWKTLVRSDTGATFACVRDSYGVIQNAVGWDVVDAIVGEGARYETGLTLKDGAVCSVLAWLDEPVQIPGDDSPLLPFLNVSWTHDGSGALRARPTSVRVVCWNTQSAAEAEGRRTDTEFTFRHSRNVMDRIEDAKFAIRGMRHAHAEYVELARELATVRVTPEQRELFLTAFIPSPPEAVISDRVAANIDEARGAVRALLDGPSVPEAHRFTAYGLHLAGGEYLDHVRGARSNETRYGRQLLRREPAKAKLTGLIRETVAA